MEANERDSEILRQIQIILERDPSKVATLNRIRGILRADLALRRAQLSLEKALYRQ